MGGLRFANEVALGIAQTLEAANETERFIFLPCGLDLTAENHVLEWMRPGFALPAIMVSYTGPRGYSGSLADGQAFSASADVIQTSRGV